LATDKVRVTARIQPELYDKFVRTSRRLCVSRSLILEQALSSWLGQDSIVLKRKRKDNGRAR
jgi:metal-responsive CopG/Arc/MetJ family transcriptional regulator